MRFLVVIVANVLALAQACLGILQLCGVKSSGHAGFLLTGTFDNPGPYGGALAVLSSVLTAYAAVADKSDKWFYKALKWLSALSALLCLILLPATMSRASWLAFGIAMFALGFRNFGLKERMAANRKATAVVILCLAVLSSGIFFLKMDSAVGRLHIWHIELRAIANNPWRGTGGGTVLGTYGMEQAEYFAEKERPEIITRVAGCPEYAFNEYLRIGVEYGVPAMLGTVLLLAVVFAWLLKRRSPLAYGLLAFCIFAFFSYPLSLFGKESDAEKEWKSVRYLCRMEFYDDAIGELLPLYDELEDNYRYLYDLGYSLHKVGRYVESSAVLEKGALVSSDPMFHNIIGKNHEAMGNFAKAEREYLLAHFMVPSRIYPLSLLMNMMIRLGRDAEAVAIGEKVRRMYVNEKVLSMKRMQKECVTKLDSLKNK